MLLGFAPGVPGSPPETKNQSVENESAIEFNSFSYTQILKDIENISCTYIFVLYITSVIQTKEGNIIYKNSFVVLCWYEDLKLQFNVNEFLIPFIFRAHPHDTCV